MQQFVRVNLAQTIEQFGKYVADEVFGNHRPVLLNELLQRTPLLVFHHHIDRVISPEEVQHADYVRMGKLGQRATFLKKTLHSIAKGRHVLVTDDRFDSALATQSETIW